MLVSPLPGANRDNLLDVIRDVKTKASNLRGGGGGRSTHERLLAYLDWANEAARMLHNQISAADIDRLLLTKRYELLLSMVGRFGPDMTFPAVNGLLSTELDQRTAALEAAYTALDAQIKYWSKPGYFVVLDTSVYITHPDKLENMDFAALLDLRGEPIHILVPVIVVDELDGLKKRGQKNVPWRASYTLAVLDRLLAHTTGAARLHEEDYSAVRTGRIPRGEVTIEVLLDPPGHVRLPINDDEIIDRALTAQPMTGRAVTLLTYDTGQSMRARSAGLRVRKLIEEMGDEPK